MTFKVERCWGGGNRYYWQVTHHTGRPARFTVGHNKNGDRWNRAAAEVIAQVVLRFTEIKRRNIRFDTCLA